MTPMPNPTTGLPEEEINEKISPTKFRVCKWLNTTTKTIVFGVDALFQGEWLHMCDDGVITSYVEESDAKKEVKRLNKIAKNTSNE